MPRARSRARPSTRRAAHLDLALSIESRSRRGARLQGSHRCRVARRRGQRAVSPRALARSRADARRRGRGRRVAAGVARRAAPARARAQAVAVPLARQGRHVRGARLAPARAALSRSPRRSAGRGVGGRKRAPARAARSRGRGARPAHRTARPPRRARPSSSAMAGTKRSAIRDRERRSFRARSRPVTATRRSSRPRRWSRSAPPTTRWPRSTIATASTGVRLPSGAARRATSGRCFATATTPPSSARCSSSSRPPMHALAPMSLVDAELDASQLDRRREAPARVSPAARRSSRQIIGVAEAPVYSRVELGSQIHVDRVRSAGAGRRRRRADRARAARARVPARARADVLVAGSRGRRVAPGSRVARRRARDRARRRGHRARQGRRARRQGRRRRRAAAAPAAREQARASALRMLSRTGGGLNLSVWAKSLTRTADRAGMLLCGDIPSAFAGRARGRRARPRSRRVRL